MRGNVKTYLLLAALGGLFMAVGYLLGGSRGMFMAFAFSCMTNLGAYYASSSLVLSMYNAQELPNKHFVTEIVSRLSKKAYMPMPKVYLVEDPQPNAFATGRNPENAAVAVTSGILEHLSKKELEGVLAHELAHIKNRDTLTMTIAATVAGAIGMLGNLLFFFGGRRDDGEDRPSAAMSIMLMILAPIAATIVQMTISRTREYEADKIGSEICGNPLWLASALENLEKASHQIHNQHAEANPSTAHMFIVNPLFGGKLASMFSTHPSTESRVSELHAIAERMNIKNVETLSEPTKRKTRKKDSFQNPWE